MTDFAPGSLVTTRGRDWVVLPESETDLLVLRPLGGSDDDIAAVFPELETVGEASFPPPTTADLGDAASARLLRTALQVGFRSGAGPFRSLGGLNVEPRAYQLVPLLMALRQETTRLLIGDDVGVGKTVEAGIIAAELLASGDAKGLAVMCSPALAEQWQDELRTKFGIDAELVLASTVAKIQRDLDLNESLFDKHPNIVVSTDFIKSPRHRDNFIRGCPDLVIVDEAHTCVTGADGFDKGRQLRHELLGRLAADPQRHLLLLTATPHSGKSSAFRNLLGLLDPSLANVDTETRRGRERLAQHFVQRKRADIRHYLDQDTEFPDDRKFKDETYLLSPAYRALLDDALAHVRGRLRAEIGLERHKTWFNAISMMRAIVSSPEAAYRTFTSASAVSRATDEAEAETIGAAVTRDWADAEQAEGIDVSPGAAGEIELTTLDRLAEQARALYGPVHDTKLALLVKQLKRLLKDGYHPIVFCKYIGTAEYLEEQLTGKLGSKTHVKSVTGRISPQSRIDRINAFAELTAEDPAAHRVLVATDCLSEGVNLQYHFDAVVHYDLAWNPTRHDQREGRVDRFGQRRSEVKVVTIYGTDNGIDGKVLEVLIRKHRRIRKDTGISVSIPDETAATVTNAIMQWLFLHADAPSEQATLPGLETVGAEIEQDWNSAADREKTSRAMYAQRPIQPDEVAAELEAVRAALGAADGIAPFTRHALHALGGMILDAPDGGFTAELSAAPVGLRDALAASLGGERIDKGLPVAFRTSPAVPKGEAALVRTDPAVSAVAGFVLNAALDRSLKPEDRPAHRCGVIRTDAVSTRTTLLLVRLRFRLVLPSRHGDRHLVAEDARLLAFEGSPERAVWLEDKAVERLLEARPIANLETNAERAAERILSGLGHLTDHLNDTAETLAAELLESHRRARTEAKQWRRGLNVTAQRPADLLGVYVYLPDPAGGLPR